MIHRQTYLDYNNTKIRNSITKNNMKAIAKSQADFKLAPHGWETDNENDELPEELPAQSCPFISDNEALPKPIPPKALAPPRFAQPKTDADVHKAKQAAVCNKTQRDTKWCVNIWNLKSRVNSFPR